MNLVKINVLLIFVIIQIRSAEMFTQWDCYYRSDGAISYCYNITQLDTRQLTGIISIYTTEDDPRYYFNVTAPDIRDWYQLCWYDVYDGLPDMCEYVVVVPTDTEYVWCVYGLQHLYSKPHYCGTRPASYVCLTTQPHTNKLLHQTIPPPVYITGVIFNTLIILVLQLKADKSVMNFLLLMLSVWDLLYLGCLVVESVIGLYTHNVQIQIHDLSYVWMDVRCGLRDSYACDMRDRWLRADNNIGIRTPHYLLMYWLHVTALVFQIASVYQTIVIATFRCIAIRRPFQASQLLTSTKAAVATGSCLLLGVAVHVPAFLAAAAVTAVRNCKIKWNDDFNKNYECLSNMTAHNPLVAASTTTIINLQHQYHIITYSIVLFLALPFMLLLVLNSVMLVELYRGTGSGTPQDNENKTVTKLVATIVTVFIITYVSKLMYIVDIFYFGGHIINSIAFQSCGCYFTAFLLMTVLPALNSGVNLLLYLGLRKTFREQFTSMFACCKRHVNPPGPEAIALQPIHR